MPCPRLLPDPCRLGISGVPFFIIGPGSSSNSSEGGDGSSGGEEAGRGGGRYSLSGAQPTAALVQAIQKVLTESQA